VSKRSPEYRSSIAIWTAETRQRQGGVIFSTLNNGTVRLWDMKSSQVLVTSSVGEDSHSSAVAIPISGRRNFGNKRAGRKGGHFLLPLEYERCSIEDIGPRSI